MTIGRQFENTFWIDHNTGDTHTWVRPEVGSPLSRTRPIHQVNTQAEDMGRPLQGLLFHPVTGTGLKDDPMVPHDARRGIIQRALDLTNTERYKENLKRTLGKITTRSTARVNRNSVQRSDISDKTAQNHIDWITNTLDYSDMPSQVLAKRQDNPIKTILDPIPGRDWAETTGRGIRLTMPKGNRTARVAETVDVKIPSNIPIGNPDFWNQLDKARSKVDGDTHNSISADDTFRLATHWVHPETGHVMTQEDAEKKYMDEKGYLHKHHVKAVEDVEDVENTMETPALLLKTMGYVPNLFPGQGDPGAKGHSIGKVGKIEVGYGDFEGPGPDYILRHFHNRMTTEGGTETKTIYKNVRVDPKLDEETMTHELGHALDKNISDSITNRGNYEVTGPVKYYYDDVKRERLHYNLKTLKSWYPDTWQNLRAIRSHASVSADPMEEGVADASADKYTRYKGQFQDVIANTETRAKDFTGSGYTVDYSGWKNQTQRALYAATRFHTALSDNQTQQIPSRSQIIDALPKAERSTIEGMSRKSNEHLDAVNSLALGHIVHNMPHVRGVLKQLGLDKAATTAHEDYKKRMGLVAPKQPTLPGMEDFV